MACRSIPNDEAGQGRHTIWQGIWEWAARTNDAQRTISTLTCQVSASFKDGEPELKTDSWPQKLAIRMIPKQAIRNVGGYYLRNTTAVLFHPQPCEAIKSLKKMMSSGFAGCVRFHTSPTSHCEVKILVLLYSIERKIYMGFIPHEQERFIDRLRFVIQQAQMQRRQERIHENLQMREIEFERKQNLLAIEHLRQILEAAQQQELEYKSQMEGDIQFNHQSQQIEEARKQNLVKIDYLTQKLEAAQQKNSSSRH